MISITTSWATFLDAIDLLHMSLYLVFLFSPNIETYAVMEYAIKRRDLNGPFDSVEELMESLGDSIGLYSRK